MKNPEQLKNRRLFTVLCILDAVWIAVIFSWSLASSDLSSKESSWVLILVQGILPFVTMHMVRKAAHFTEFMILGALLSATAGVWLTNRKERSEESRPDRRDDRSDKSRSDRRDGLSDESRSDRRNGLSDESQQDRRDGRRAGSLQQLGIASGIGLAAAICDELIQLTSPGRSCQISDMLLDFCGVLAGALILMLVFRIIINRHRRC